MVLRHAQGMRTEQSTLADQIVASEPLSKSGASGNTLERVTLRDGRVLVRKQVSPAWDWISRATGDEGRALVMWDAGVFQGMPDGVDHATVGVEPTPDGWAIYMRDVSRHLFPAEGRVASEEVRRVVSGLAELHRAFLGTDIQGLCSLVDRYHLLSPRTAQRETALGNPAGPLISRCWDAFVELAPPDVSGPIVALAGDPTPLAAELLRCEQTLVHGDARLWNMGLSDDGLVMIDWGERTGMAPAPVEIAAFVAFDAKYLELTRDEVLQEYRSLTSDFVDDASFDLAMIGGLVQLGCHHVLDLVLKGTHDARQYADQALAWWSATVRRAFERTWAPT